MRIIDCNASCGHWPGHDCATYRMADVWKELHEYGVDRAFVASLDSAWCMNPHAPNERLIENASHHEGVSPVPTLDPTIHTWRDQLANIGRLGNVRMVRLTPSYGNYELSAAEELLEEARLAGLAVQIQTRLEDSRRHHPKAQVPDVMAKDVIEVARQYPALTVVIGGARWAELRSLKDEILSVKLLYADTSQCDGMDGVKVLCDEGLRERLLFGSHSPLFEVPSALRRIVDDLDDETAEMILSSNAVRAIWRP